MKKDDLEWRIAAPRFGTLRDRRRQAKRGAVLALLVWDHEAGEGEVLLAPEWEHCGGVLRADAIDDWMGLLNRDLEDESAPYF